MNTKIIIAIICILGILAGIIGYVTYTRNNEKKITGIEMYMFHKCIAGAIE